MTITFPNKLGFDCICKLNSPTEKAIGQLDGYFHAIMRACMLGENL